MSTKRATFAIVVFAMLCLLFFAERALRPPTKRIYDGLLNEHSASKQEIKLFQRFVEVIAKKSGEQRRINVNGKYDDTTINVALINFDAIDRSKWGIPKDGMLAFPPNLLVVDLRTMRNIVRHAFNDAGYFSQMIGMAMKAKNKEDILPQAITLGAISLQLRLANFAVEDTADSDFALTIATALNSFELQNQFTLPFVIFIAHELYHLRPGGVRGLDMSVEELNADKQAREIAHRFLSKGGAPEAIGPILEKQLLFAGLRYFQDKLLEQSFRSFRGLSADDVLVAMFHGDCEKAKTVPWPQRFNNPDVVVYAEPKNFPVLTESEILEIRKRLSRFSSRYHEHILERIARLKKIFSEDEMLKDSVVIFEKSQQLDDIYHGRILKRSDTRSDDQIPAAGNLTMSSLMKRLHTQRAPVSITGCENDKCIVGSIGAGHIEIFGSEGRVSVATLALPPSVEGRAAALAALDELVGMDRAFPLMSHVSGALGACGVASIFEDRGAYDVRIRTMNEEGWIEIEAAAKGE